MIEATRIYFSIGGHAFAGATARIYLDFHVAGACLHAHEAVHVLTWLASDRHAHMKILAWTGILEL